MDEHTRRSWGMSGLVINACIEVHRQVGPGLLESVYEECLAHELTLRGVPHRRQAPISLEYKGISIPGAYRADLVVDDLVLIELKAVDRLLAVHEAQVLTYLALLRIDVGLLVNFNDLRVSYGIRRLIRKGASIGRMST
jgi:GxxExxY protein